MMLRVSTTCCRLPSAAADTLETSLKSICHTLLGVGRSSGFIIAWSTVGSIAGVFVSGFILIDRMKVSHIFRVMGGMTVLLGFLCVALDRWLVAGGTREGKEAAQ